MLFESLLFYSGDMRADTAFYLLNTGSRLTTKNIIYNNQRIEAY